MRYLSFKRFENKIKNTLFLRLEFISNISEDIHTNKNEEILQL